MAMVYSKLIQYITLGNSIKGLNIFMEERSTLMKFMRENSNLIFEEGMVFDTQNNTLMRESSIKEFYMERENGKMETFTKVLF